MTNEQARPPGGPVSPSTQVDAGPVDAERVVANAASQAAFPPPPPKGAGLGVAPFQPPIPTATPSAEGTPGARPQDAPAPAAFASATSLPNLPTAEPPPVEAQPVAAPPSPAPPMPAPVADLASPVRVADPLGVPAPLRVADPGGALVPPVDALSSTLRAATPSTDPLGGAGGTAVQPAPAAGALDSNIAATILGVDPAPAVEPTPAAADPVVVDVVAPVAKVASARPNRRTLILLAALGAVMLVMGGLFLFLRSGAETTAEEVAPSASASAKAKKKKKKTKAKPEGKPTRPTSTAKRPVRSAPPPGSVPPGASAGGDEEETEELDDEGTAAPTVRQPRAPRRPPRAQ